MTGTPSGQRGLTLIELLVAFVIMAFSLGALYRASGNAAHGVALTEQHVRASQLARSLLQAHDALPPEGWNESGESGGVRWRVASAPYETPVSGSKVTRLHQLRVVVGWQADGQARELAFSTLLPQADEALKGPK